MEENEIDDQNFTNLCNTVIQILAGDIERAGLQVEGFDIDADLMELNVLDSFGFLVLISEYEKQTGISIDLTRVNHAVLTSVRGFVSSFNAVPTQN